MACKSCQESREWLARYRKETGSSAAKALLALYRKGKEGGEAGKLGNGFPEPNTGTGEDPVADTGGVAVDTGRAGTDQ